MNWNESEIIVSNGVRYLNQEASQRFFEEYKEEFLKHNRTSVKFLKEEFCINLLKRLNIVPEVQVVEIPYTYSAGPSNDDENEEEIDEPEETQEENIEEEEVIEETIETEEENLEDEEEKDPFLMLIISEFEEYLIREHINEITSQNIAEFCVGLNDNTHFYGRNFQKDEMESIGDSLAKKYSVNFDKKDISKLVRERIAARKSQEEPKVGINDDETIDSDLLESVIRVEAERELKERIANDLEAVITDCGTDYEKVVEVCNLAIKSGKYTKNEVAMVLFNTLGKTVDLEDEEVVNQLEQDFEDIGLECYREFKKYLDKYINEEEGFSDLEEDVEDLEDLEDLEDEEELEEETRLRVVRRRKPKTKEEKKKIVYSLIAGAGIISAGLLTFVAKMNPITVIGDCAESFKGLFTSNASLLELASKLGSLTAYFGSVVAGWVGASKLAKLYEKEEKKNQDNEEEIVDISVLDTGRSSVVVDEEELSLEEQDAMNLASLFMEEEEDRKVK